MATLPAPEYVRAESTGSAMLTTCHECGHEVSEEARRCPSCGARLKEGTGTDPLMRGRGKADLALAVMLALVVVGVMCA